MGWLTVQPRSATIKTTPKDRLAITGSFCRGPVLISVTVITFNCSTESFFNSR
jgi:hypothetical protein